jgi:ubiquinone/menaquinone biosynthesis C-methylase UbiE
MRGHAYRRNARWYDTFIGPVTHDLRAVGMTMTFTHEAMRVLDVACGTGITLDLYQGRGCRVFGIDSSAAMLEVARRKLGERADLRLGDAARMPYPDGVFDLVTMVLALHEMPPADRSAVLDEIRRVVRNDGRILLIDYHPGPIRFPSGWLSKMVITFFEVSAGGDHLRNYRDFLSRQGLPTLINNHQLVIETRRILGGGSLGLFLLTRK